MKSARMALQLAGALLALLAAPLPAQTGGGASVTVLNGPHKGEYGFAPTETCFIAAFGAKPQGLSVVMSSLEASLSIDLPDLDDKHGGEMRVVLVIAERRTAGATSSVTYEIDTRPDAALEPFEKAERGGKGVSGKASSTLMHKGDSALLSFSGETPGGIRLEGSITCRRVA